MTATVERDLNDVRVFAKVVEAKGFSAAARLLGLPTSTVSRRVARLEKALGVRLLQRTTRKLSLTDAGRLYYESGTRVLSELEYAENVIAESLQSPRGRLRVAAPAEHAVTMKLVIDFLSQYSDVRVDLELTGRSVNILEEGFDVSIHAGELPSLSVAAHKLIDSPFVMVASDAYLRSRGDPAGLGELVDHDCIVFGTSTSNAHWEFSVRGRTKKVAVHGRIAVNHLLGVREAAVAGHGIAMLPRLVCTEELDSGDLRVVLPGMSPSPVPVFVTYPAGRFLSPAARSFVDFVRAHFPRLAGDLGKRRRAKGQKRSKKTR